MAMDATLQIRINGEIKRNLGTFLLRPCVFLLSKVSGKAVCPSVQR